jgi:positive regulator of sigma E activity
MEAADLSTCLLLLLLLGVTVLQVKHHSTCSSCNSSSRCIAGTAASPARPHI